MSILAADLEVRATANVDDALKKLASIDAAVQKATLALNKESKLNLDTADADKKLATFTNKLKAGFKASLSASVSGLKEAGGSLLAGDPTGIVKGLTDSVMGLTSQIPGVGMAMKLLGGSFEALIQKGFEFNATWGRNKNLLIAMGETAEGAEKQLNGLFNMAVQRGFESKSLITINEHLRSIGFTATESTKLLSAFTNAAASVGGDASTIEAFATAFERMKDSEETGARIIKQFEGLNIPIYDILADATGMSKASLRKKVKHGQIPTQGLMDILTDEFTDGSRYGNLAENLTKTSTNGQLNAFNENFAKRAGQITIDAYKDLGARLHDLNVIIGLNNADGLIQGFRKGVSIPLSIADYGIQAFLDGIKLALGIHSPSAVVAELIGKPMGLGLIAGFEQALQQEGDRIEKGATKIITRAGDTLSKIAERYNIPLEKLMNVNKGHQADDELDAGQQVRVPNVPDSSWRGKPSRRITNPINNSLGSLGERATNEALLDNPQVQAMLALIRHFEAGDDYASKFGGGEFTGGLNQSTFPFSQARTRVWSPTLHRFVTTAAEGGYQFEPKTWQSVANANGLTDISQHNQDIGAVSLLRARGALPDVLSGNLMGALNKVADEWEIFKVALTQKPALLSKMQEFYGGGKGMAAQLQDGILAPQAPTQLPMPERQPVKPEAPIEFRGATQDFKKQWQEIQDRLQALFAALPNEDLVKLLLKVSMSTNQKEELQTFAAFRGTNIDNATPETINKLAIEYESYIAQELAYRQKVLDTQQANLKATEDYQQKLQAYNDSLKNVSSDNPDPMKTLLDGFLGRDKVTTDPLSLSSVLIPHELTPLNLFDDLGNQSNKSPRSQSAQAANRKRFGMAAFMQEELKKIRDEIPSLKQQFADFFTSLPQGIGGIFGNAVKQWDGTFKGFFSSVAQGFAQMLKNLAAQLLESAVTKLLSKLFGSLLGGFLGGKGGFANLGNGIADDAGTGFAVGGMISPEAGGKIVRVGEAGFAELILSTDPSYRERTSRLMGDFIQRTDIAPKFAMGGWSDIDRIGTSRGHFNQDSRHGTSGAQVTNNTNHYHIHLPASRGGQYMQPRDQHALVRDIARMIGNT